MATPINFDRLLTDFSLFSRTPGKYEISSNRHSIEQLRAAVEAHGFRVTRSKINRFSCAIVYFTTFK